MKKNLERKKKIRSGRMNGCVHWYPYISRAVFRELYVTNFAEG